MLDAYTDSVMGICDKMPNNTKFSSSWKTAMFCKISSDVAPENGKRWAYGFTMDHLSTKTTRVCLVLNVCYQNKIDNIIKYANYFPETRSQIVIGTIYYHFHIGYKAVR